MKYTLLAALACFMAACNHGIPEETIKADAAMLANLQCEAKKLQDERFKLATDIRLLEDSIMNGQDSALVAGYKVKLEVLSSLKDNMWLRTKTMADSITNTLTQLHQGTYKDTADRKLLDVALTDQFEQICK